MGSLGQLNDKDIGEYLAIQFSLDVGSFLPATDTCTPCTLKHGGFITPEFSIGALQVENFSVEISAPVCPAGFQCVSENGSDSEGCCERCKSNQICLPGTICLGADESSSWNVCPPGFQCDSFAPTVWSAMVQCEAGTMCMNNKKLPCTDVRQIPIDAGYGDIHAGSYCPKGSFGMEFCPMGRYCNSTDMTTSFPCPEGKFCPYKTEVPAINCIGCAEGATERKINPILALIIILVIVAIPVCILLAQYAYPAYLKRKGEKAEKSNPTSARATESTLARNQINQSDMDMKRMMSVVYTSSNQIPGSQAPQPRGHLMESMMMQFGDNEAKEKFSDNEDKENSDREIAGRAMLEKLRSQVSAIAEESWDTSQRSIVSPRPSTAEIPGGSSSSVQIPILSSKRDFDDDVPGFGLDPDIIFDKMDINGDGEIDFDELNDVLQLPEVKLRFFVRRINRLDGAPLDATTISRRCFVEHFLDVLDKTDNFEPDEEEAAEIFEALDLDGSGTITKQEFHSPVMENILSDRQIRLMMKKMANKNQSIDKETFVKMYPLLLSEIDDMKTQKCMDRSVDITFKDLSLTIGKKQENKKIVVDSVTGRIQESTMTALMGGSGAGKTSLLNTLCGRAFYGKVSGQIFINGSAGHIEDHKHLLGFVPQDDIVHAELTVRENLIYAGRFKLPPETTDEEIEELADDVIANLGLMRARDSIVGDVRRRGVSGGEKKRVNIGVELMGKPRVLFLDEPTSGLDASSSTLVMASLKSLVHDDGVTIVSVIHQPRKFIFELFDNVILLGDGGKIVYHGGPQLTQAYFENIGYTLPPGESVSDWLLDISSGQLGIPSQQESKNVLNDLMNAKEFLFDAWETHFHSLSEEERESFDPPAPFEIPSDQAKPSFFLQLKYHIKRNLLVGYRNRNFKVTDTFLIFIAVAALSVINGQLFFAHPLVIEEIQKLFGGRVGAPLIFIESIEAIDVDGRLAQLFEPFRTSALVYRAGGQKIAIIVAVLVALSATKVISEKKLEFYRESSSGYNVNAYFTAVNITSTIETTIQMILSGFVCAVITAPISSWGAFILNFVMLGWGSGAWAMFFSIIASPQNIVLMTGMFLAFCNIILSGGLQPVVFETLYNSPFLLVLAGLFAPGRFFVETWVASDYKCFPEQTGFTVTTDAVSVPQEALPLYDLQVGQHDENIYLFSCHGWYGGYLPAFIIGLTWRFVAGALLHVVDRPKQSKSSFRIALKNKSFLCGAIIYLGTVLVLGVVSIFLIFSWPVR